MRRFSVTFLSAILIALVIAAVSSGQGTAWNTEGVLDMMDKSARDFHTLTADIEHIKYTDVV
ncbi:MAG: hypothetical protein ABLT11_10595, partial [Candidatus Acidiferrum sp.]